MPKEYLEKYKQGIYNNALKHWNECIEEIRSLEIKYPSNAQPIFYIYIVPNDAIVELLDFPKKLGTKSGGKPVLAYDLDSYSSAYGTSSNLMENINNFSVSRKAIHIHELAHLVQGMFFSKNQFLEEGFAETLAFYILGYEKIFEEHRHLLESLDEEQILTVKELIKLGNEHKFHPQRLIPNSSCSFEITYISSYLFVRGLIEKIEEKYRIDKFTAMQTFLEMIRTVKCFDEWLVFDIASFLDLPKEMLLYRKEIQMCTLLRIEGNEKNKMI